MISVQIDTLLHLGCKRVSVFLDNINYMHI